MKKHEYTTKQERKLKFAEAGVLFVLVLALTVFIGARVITRGGEEIAVGEAAAPGSVVTPAIPAAVESTVVAAPAEHPAEIAAEDPAAPVPAAEPRTPAVVTYGEAEAAYLARDYAAAARLFDAYTTQNPANAWGHYMQGLSEWKAGDLDAAEEAFVAALEIKPDHARSLVNYGRVLLAQDRPADARVQLELALAADPAGVDARRVMARIQHASGELEAAADSYLAVLGSRGDDGWSLNNLGLIRIQQGRYAEALAPLAKAARLMPATACIQNNLGIALERAGHFGAAGEAFAAALEADGDHAKAAISLERVAEQEAAHGSEPVDLVALAESFRADSRIEVAEEAGTDPPAGDMEVASAGLDPATVEAAEEAAEAEDAAAATGSASEEETDDGGR